MKNLDFSFVELMSIREALNDYKYKLQRDISIYESLDDADDDVVDTINFFNKELSHCYLALSKIEKSL